MCLRKCNFKVVFSNQHMLCIYLNEDAIDILCIIFVILKIFMQTELYVVDLYKKL